MPIQMAAKITLAAKGETTTLDLSGVKSVKGTLRWTDPIDLDFYAICRTKATQKKGFLGGNKEVPAQDVVISFRNKGDLREIPYISLDKDAGVGDKGGANEENLNLAPEAFAACDHILIAANIYNKSNAVFGSYNGKVTIKTDRGEIEVPLTSKPAHGRTVSAGTVIKRRTFRAMGLLKRCIAQPKKVHYIHKGKETLT